MATQSQLRDKFLANIKRNLKLINQMEIIYEKTGYHAIDGNCTFRDEIFPRIKEEIKNTWNNDVNVVGGKILDETWIKSKNKFLLTQSKRLIKHMEVPRYTYDEDNEENPEFMKIQEIWSNFSYKL
jgi:hypothetical protein